MSSAFQYDVFLSRNRADKLRVPVLCLSPEAFGSARVAPEERDCPVSATSGQDDMLHQTHQKPTCNMKRCTQLNKGHG